MLKSPAHKTFKITKGIAEELGYLNSSDDLGIGNLDDNSFGKPRATNEPDSPTPSNQHQAQALSPCTKPNCTCPQFEFAPSKHTPAEPTTGFRSFASLDGAAGSTLYAHAPEGSEDPQDVTLSFEPPLPTIDPEDIEPYVRPPDSDDEDMVPSEAPAAGTGRTREKQNQFEIKKRFAKGKTRKARRQAQREAKSHRNQAYEHIIPVIEAYVAADEKLFGQKRFEEVDDTKNDQPTALANWQQEVGMTNYADEDKKAADQLVKDIENLIQDVLSEIRMETEEEYRSKASSRHQNKLFFEDTLEDVAIDHEFRIADQGQEKLRKDIGKKQIKELREMKMGDIVDDIAMGHIQGVGEREEEHRRKTFGKIQSKELTSIKMDDIVDDLAMDHVQEIGEKEQEYYRRGVSRAQNRKLTDIKMLDHVDDFAMEHLQEVSERAQEHHRNIFGMKETKKFAEGREADLVDCIMMDHKQEVGKKEQEQRRKAFGMTQTKKLKPADRKGVDLTDPIVLDLTQRSAGEITPHDRYPILDNTIETAHGDINLNETTSKTYRADKKEREVWYEQASMVTRDNLAGSKIPLDRPEPAEVDYEHFLDPQVTVESKQGSSSTKIKFKLRFTAKAEANNNNCKDDDGYSSPPPIPKKNRRQLRKEANERFEAMMEQMVKAQEK